MVLACSADPRGTHRSDDFPYLLLSVEHILTYDTWRNYTLYNWYSASFLLYGALSKYLLGLCRVRQKITAIPVAIHPKRYDANGTIILLLLSVLISYQHSVLLSSTRCQV